MTGEEFFELWSDKGLRQAIVNKAKWRSKRKELQEEYVQEAWLLISTAPAGYSTKAYIDLAYKAIYSSYWQNHKNALPFESLGGVRVSYGTNPFDSREILINGKTPVRKNQDKDSYGYTEE